MKALVTGAAGFFGLAIVRALARTGDVVATDVAPPSAFNPRHEAGDSSVEYVQLDLRSGSPRALATDVDVVVHAAAITPAAEQGAVLDDVLAVNLTPLGEVLAAVRESDRCTRLLFVSSAGADDQGSGSLLRGTTPPAAPASMAPPSRGRAPRRRYARARQSEYVVVRPTSLFGEGEAERPSRPRAPRSAARSPPRRAASRCGSRAWTRGPTGCASTTPPTRRGAAAPPRRCRVAPTASRAARPRPFPEVADGVVCRARTRRRRRRD